MAGASGKSERNFARAIQGLGFLGSVSTVAILAQGAKPAVAVTQAFFARFKPRPLAKGFPFGKEDLQSMKTSPCQARV
jgi:hypothetical protein